MNTDDQIILSPPAKKIKLMAKYNTNEKNTDAIGDIKPKILGGATDVMVAAKTDDQVTPNNSPEKETKPKEKQEQDVVDSIDQSQTDKDNNQIATGKNEKLTKDIPNALVPKDKTNKDIIEPTVKKDDDQKTDNVEEKQTSGESDDESIDINDIDI